MGYVADVSGPPGARRRSTNSGYRTQRKGAVPMLEVCRVLGGLQEVLPSLHEYLSGNGGGLEHSHCPHGSPIECVECVTRPRCAPNAPLPTMSP